jgi:hypothetical protein
MISAARYSYMDEMEQPLYDSLSLGLGMTLLSV